MTVAEGLEAWGDKNQHTADPRYQPATMLAVALDSLNPKSADYRAVCATVRELRACISDIEDAASAAGFTADQAKHAYELDEQGWITDEPDRPDDPPDPRADGGPGSTDIRPPGTPAPGATSATPAS